MGATSVETNLIKRAPLRRRPPGIGLVGSGKCKKILNKLTRDPFPQSSGSTTRAPRPPQRPRSASATRIKHSSTSNRGCHQVSRCAADRNHPGSEKDPHGIPSHVTPLFPWYVHHCLCCAGNWLLIHCAGTVPYPRVQIDRDLPRQTAGDTSPATLWTSLKWHALTLSRSTVPRRVCVPPA